MIIDNFYIFRTCIRPAKANSPLIVNPNAVLTRAITLKRFETIAGQYPQIVESTRNLQLSELASCYLSDIGELPDLIAF